MAAEVADDYSRVVVEADAATDEQPGQQKRSLGRLRRELRRIRARHYFPPPERGQALAAVEALAALGEEPVR